MKSKLDKKYILTKITECIDAESRVHDKIVEPKETEMIIADELKINVSFSPVEESVFWELESITNPLLELIRTIVDVDSDSFASDDVSNTVFDIDIPLEERVERLLKINEQMEEIQS